VDRKRETAFIGIGSNTGDRMSFCRNAAQALQAAEGVRGARVSSLFETVPVGYLKQNRFYNAVLQIETTLSPLNLLFRCQEIEQRFRKKIAFPNGPRTIDLDLLFHGDTVCDTPELTLPHPELAHRFFVLIPLAEIAPDFIHPVLHLTVRGLLHRLKPSPSTGVKRRLGPGWEKEGGP